MLTDNGTEFDNQLLKELCRLWRIKLCYTPPLHPQSNYTERVNRYIGETLRNLVDAPGARRGVLVFVGRRHKPLGESAWRRLRVSVLPVSSIPPCHIPFGWTSGCHPPVCTLSSSGHRRRVPEARGRMAETCKGGTCDMACSAGSEPTSTRTAPMASACVNTVETEMRGADTSTTWHCADGST